MPSVPPGQRIVVVSPHSDDGVLSVGGTMARWARGGARVELLTVFALDPESRAATGGWDRRAGFRTEAEAARARRVEDEAACAVLGAYPMWLPFGSVDYDRHGDEDAMLARVSEAVEGADLAVVPGAPLTHPDHLWLTRVLVERSVPAAKLWGYAEQPYWSKLPESPRRPTSPEWLAAAAGASPLFEDARVTPREALLKLRAVRRYRSQLPLLRLTLRDALLYRLLRREALASLV